VAQFVAMAQEVSGLEVGITHGLIHLAPVLANEARTAKLQIGKI
jgi:hypothetical protein